MRTVESVRGILSPSTVLDNAFRHPTFLPALRQHGVETCGFFSRRKIGLRHFLGANTRDDLGTMLSFKSLRKKVCTDELAGTLLPKIREVLADAENGTPRQQFYLYYGEGSHVPFLGYDFDKHSVFTPNGKQKYNDERDVNNYDNTFIALAEFCAGFIDALRDKNAVYILVGDHGETLGEGCVWGRRYRNKETRHVLFFVWASEKFKAENPELWATLLRNRERLGVISHDFVYNSVLHLFSIETPYYDEHADLFSDAANPFPTEMPEAEGFGPLRFGENAETKIQFHGGKF
ncbi:MAG: sulfatase-like hydrolase/transferase [Opitutae bacterium]|nr:sulfatase-like hydrolase/transferase [Opitutae bacterium]